MNRISRNYRNENRWQRETYTRFQASLRKEEAEILNEELKKEEIGFTEWVRRRIKICEK